MKMKAAMKRTGAAAFAVLGLLPTPVAAFFPILGYLLWSFVIYMIIKAIVSWTSAMVILLMAPVIIFVQINPCVYAPPTAPGGQCAAYTIELPQGTSFITMNVDKGIQNINKTIMFQLQLFYIAAITGIGFYLIFMSSSPQGRANAKELFIRLLIGMILVSQAPVIFQIFLDVVRLITNTLITNATKDMYNLNRVTTVYTEAKYCCTMFIFMAIVALAGLIAAFRYFLVYIMASFFPLTLFLYYTDVPNPLFSMRGLGTRFFRFTILLFVTQILQVLCLCVGIVLSNTPNPSLFDFLLMLASFGGVVFTPMIGMQLMEWVGAVVHVSAVRPGTQLTRFLGTWMRTGRIDSAMATASGQYMIGHNVSEHVGGGGSAGKGAAADNISPRYDLPNFDQSVRRAGETGPRGYSPTFGASGSPSSSSGGGPQAAGGGGQQPSAGGGQYSPFGGGRQGASPGSPSAPGQQSSPPGGGPPAGGGGATGGQAPAGISAAGSSLASQGGMGTGGSLAQAASAGGIGEPGGSQGGAGGGGGSGGGAGGGTGGGGGAAEGAGGGAGGGTGGGGGTAEGAGGAGGGGGGGAGGGGAGSGGGAGGGGGGSGGGAEGGGGGGQQGVESLPGGQDQSSGTQDQGPIGGDQTGNIQQERPQMPESMQGGRVSVGHEAGGAGAGAVGGLGGPGGRQGRPDAVKGAGVKTHSLPSPSAGMKTMGGPQSGGGTEGGKEPTPEGAGAGGAAGGPPGGPGEEGAPGKGEQDHLDRDKSEAAKARAAAEKTGAEAGKAPSAPSRGRPGKAEQATGQPGAPKGEPGVVQAGTPGQMPRIIEEGAPGQPAPGVVGGREGAPGQPSGGPGAGPSAQIPIPGGGYAGPSGEGLGPMGQPLAPGAPGQAAFQGEPKPGMAAQAGQTTWAAAQQGQQPVERLSVLEHAAAFGLSTDAQGDVAAANEESRKFNLWADNLVNRLNREAEQDVANQRALAERKFAMLGQSGNAEADAQARKAATDFFKKALDVDDRQANTMFDKVVGTARKTGDGIWADSSLGVGAMVAAVQEMGLRSKEPMSMAQKGELFGRYVDNYDKPHKLTVTGSTEGVENPGPAPSLGKRRGSEFSTFVSELEQKQLNAVAALDAVIGHQSAQRFGNNTDGFKLNWNTADSLFDKARTYADPVTGEQDPLAYLLAAAKRAEEPTRPPAPMGSPSAQPEYVEPGYSGEIAERMKNDELRGSDTTTKHAIGISGGAFRIDGKTQGQWADIYRSRVQMLGENNDTDTRVDGLSRQGVDRVMNGLLKTKGVSDFVYKALQTDGYMAPETVLDVMPTEERRRIVKMAMNQFSPNDARIKPLLGVELQGSVRDYHQLPTVFAEKQKTAYDGLVKAARATERVNPEEAKRLRAEAEEILRASAGQTVPIAGPEPSEAPIPAPAPPTPAPPASYEYELSEGQTNVLRELKRGEFGGIAGGQVPSEQDHMEKDVALMMHSLGAASGLGKDNTADILRDREVVKLLRDVQELDPSEQRAALFSGVNALVKARMQASGANKYQVEGMLNSLRDGRRQLEHARQRQVLSGLNAEDGSAEREAAINHLQAFFERRGKGLSREELLHAKFVDYSSDKAAMGRLQAQGLGDIVPYAVVMDERAWEQGVVSGAPSLKEKLVGQGDWNGINYDPTKDELLGLSFISGKADAAVQGSPSVGQGTKVTIFHEAGHDAFMTSSLQSTVLEQGAQLRLINELHSYFVLETAAGKYRGADEIAGILRKKYIDYYGANLTDAEKRQLASEIDYSVKGIERLMFQIDPSTNSAVIDPKTKLPKLKEGISLGVASHVIRNTDQFSRLGSYASLSVDELDYVSGFKQTREDAAKLIEAGKMQEAAERLRRFAEPGVEITAENAALMLQKMEADYKAGVAAEKESGWTPPAPPKKAPTPEAAASRLTAPDISKKVEEGLENQMRRAEELDASHEKARKIALERAAELDKWKAEMQARDAERRAKEGEPIEGEEASEEEPAPEEPVGTVEPKKKKTRKDRDRDYSLAP